MSSQTFGFASSFITEGLLASGATALGSVKQWEPDAGC
jgi:hypothetical protein